MLSMPLYSLTDGDTWAGLNSSFMIKQSLGKVPVLVVSRPRKQGLNQGFNSAAAERRPGALGLSL